MPVGPSLARVSTTHRGAGHSSPHPAGTPPARGPNGERQREACRIASSQSQSESIATGDGEKAQGAMVGITRQVGEWPGKGGHRWDTESGRDGR